MSVSKLESLPNEILIDILEKYINALDILNAFAFQLNQRFDALITGCQRLRFDFIRCYKNDFRLCMGLLPAYIDKIEELALSEQNTPGQIHAFLSFCPSFDLFKRLRKLYFHLNAEAVQLNVLTIAPHSLLKTSLYTLCIEIKKGHKISSLNNTIVDIFGMKTLKKLSITCDSYTMQWRALSDVHSNIEYLTIDGILCDMEDLEHIFRCVSDLKYLDIQIEHAGHYNSYKPKSSSEDITLRMSMLRTALFKIKGDYLTIYSDLKSCLRCMPSLHRLEISGHRGLNTINIWQTLLETWVPMLTHFSLESSVSNLQSGRINYLLKSIQTPFWIEKKNFNIIIKKGTNSTVTNNLGLINVQDINPYLSEDPADLWWLGPRRQLNDNLSATSKISSLRLSGESNSLFKDHYLENVNHLVVEELTDNLLKLITTHVNCSRIRHLDVTCLKPGMDTISLFLPYIRNIASLRINFNQLFEDRFGYFKECNNLKFLNTSAVQHGFNEKHIFTIANIFPNVEQLIINTQDLQNVPMLKIYLPRLCSLTFPHLERSNVFPLDRYREQRADENLRQTSQFLFHRDSGWITVWMDEATLQDFYWKTTDTS